MKISEKRRVGDIGENIAIQFLKTKGFIILEKNYWKKWGEIDIIAKNKDILHFIEVKSVMRENMEDISLLGFDPVDNMHSEKKKRQKRIIETYLIDKNLEDDFQIDLMLVYLNEKTKKAKVELIDNIDLN